MYHLHTSDQRLELKFIIYIPQHLRVYSDIPQLVVSHSITCGFSQPALHRHVRTIPQLPITIIAVNNMMQSFHLRIMVIMYCIHGNYAWKSLLMIDFHVIVHFTFIINQKM